MFAVVVVAAVVVVLVVGGVVGVIGVRACMGYDGMVAIICKAVIGSCFYLNTLAGKNSTAFSVAAVAAAVAAVVAAVAAAAVGWLLLMVLIHGQIHSPDVAIIIQV